jgi:hypothetical protein
MDGFAARIQNKLSELPLTTKLSFTTSKGSVELGCSELSRFVETLYNQGKFSGLLFDYFLAKVSREDKVLLIITGWYKNDLLRSRAPEIRPGVTTVLIPCFSSQHRTLIEIDMIAAIILYYSPHDPYGQRYYALQRSLTQNGQALRPWKCLRRPYQQRIYLSED